MGEYTYEFYKDKDGLSEVFSFLETLTEKIKNNNDKRSRSLLNSFYVRIKKLEVNGTRDGMPDFEFIGGKYKLWQIRIKHVTGLYRFFICQCPYEKNKFIILSYFIKDEGRTPNREIEKAERLMVDYLKRRV